MQSIGGGRTSNQQRQFQEPSQSQHSRVFRRDWISLSLLIDARAKKGPKVTHQGAEQHQGEMMLVASPRRPAP